MGEFELLARLRERLPEDHARVIVGSGDDAAVTVPAGATATSVDAIVEGVHFRRGESSLQAVGGKALATALSDLAAMGAEAGEAFVALGAPAELAEEDFLALLDGLLQLAAETGTTLAGGDLTRAPALTLAVTVVGHAASPQDFVTRGGARPGDLLVVTGELGGAAAGRLLLDEPSLAESVSEATAESLRQRQLEPRPRLRSGRALARAGARAMIDLSDGLAGDAQHLGTESSALLRIDAASLPLAEGVAEVAVAVGVEPIQLAVSGGEDYELLAAIPPATLGRAVAAVGEEGEGALTAIGEVGAGEGGVEIRLRGECLEPCGFDHFGNR